MPTVKLAADVLLTRKSGQPPAVQTGVEIVLLLLPLLLAGSPPPETVAVLFTLGAGKSRLVADPSGRGFFVVKTNKITPGDASGNPALIAQTQAAFQQNAPDELAAQLLTALKADVGVKRNDKLSAAAKTRITGSGN